MRRVLETSVNEQMVARARPRLRLSICRTCAARPPGSESWDEHTPRSCEAECEIFKQLPGLIRIARCIDPSLASFEHVMDGHLEWLAQPVVGDCETCQRRRAWSRHRGCVIRVLQDIVGHY